MKENDCKKPIGFGMVLIIGAFIITGVFMFVSYAIGTYTIAIPFDKSLNNTCGETISQTNVHPAWNVTTVCLDNVVCHRISDPNTEELLAMYCNERTPENEVFCECK